MSKDVYENLDSLFADLLKDIQTSVAQEIAEQIIDIEQDIIDENVYEAFEPRVYERREDEGGLRSRENMDIKIKSNDNGVTVEVTNITKGNSDYKNYYRGYIQPLIEEGRYMWTRRPPARPFVDDVQKEIDKNAEDIVEEALSKNNW